MKMDRLKAGAMTPGPKLIVHSVTTATTKFVICILALAIQQHQVGCSKVTVAIPELVKLNDAFWLNCSHETPPKSLLFTSSQLSAQDSVQQRYSNIASITWFKGEKSFYRFVPNVGTPSAQPKVLVWPTPGVQLDERKSFEGNVFMAKADVMSEGSYRCEIVFEPDFHTVRKSMELKVFALPVRGPRIEILDSNGKPMNPKEREITYEVGDKIELRCNSNPSKPPARLRWYLNDREVHVPDPLPTSDGHGDKFLPANLTNQKSPGYNVRVTPIEHRDHYKGISSSHSSLSVVLDRNNLMNGRISFKCLASIREDILIDSKQLILMTPQASPETANNLKYSRFKRSPVDRSRDLSNNLGNGHQPRHRAQYNRPVPMNRSPQSAEAAKMLADLSENRRLVSSMIKMMYIYEDSDTTLGPSIIDSPEILESYLGSLLNETDRDVYNNLLSSMQLNRAENMEYIQMLRDKSWRKKSPIGSPQGATSHKRTYGPNTLVRSPFYLDENDPLRPVINWPPLDSGKLMLVPGQSIVAIPTQEGSANPEGRIGFVQPPSNTGTGSETIVLSSSPLDDPIGTSRAILDRLIEHLSCSSAEVLTDTKLSWIVNEHALTSSDVRTHQTRGTSDHRQPLVSISLLANSSQPCFGQKADAKLSCIAGSLASILSNYYKRVEAQARIMNSQYAALRSAPSRHQGPIGNDQLKFTCRVEQSFLLYSSSEMITFDFGAINEIDGNPLDKLSTSPSNVIQAATASSTRSNSSPSQMMSMIIFKGSQQATMALMIISSMYIILSGQLVTS